MKTPKKKSKPKNSPKKHEVMPENPAENYSTSALAGILTGAVANEDSLTPAQIGAELLYRVIPNDDVAGTTEYRGGVRPTHIPTH